MTIVDEDPCGATADELSTATSSMAISKADSVRKLLARKRGATVAEIAKLTDWQPHSIRAFLSGVRRKVGPLVREPRRTGEQAYRLAPAEKGTA
jgi:hypothetical protein